MTNNYTIERTFAYQATTSYLFEAGSEQSEHTVYLLGQDRRPACAVSDADSGQQLALFDLGEIEVFNDILLFVAGDAAHVN